MDWRAVVTELDDGVIVVDDRATVVGCNPAAGRLLGRSSDGLVGTRVDDLPLDVVASDGSPLPATVVLSTGAPTAASVVGVGRWLSVVARPLPGDGRAAVVTLTDVTDEREREERLRRLADCDDLTGLPNRRRFVELLELHLASRRREDARGALVMLDLDRFKELNDAFGHAAGDRVLVRVAAALGERLRGDDVIARLGGDEFAVLLPRAWPDEAAQVAAAIVERLRQEQIPDRHGGSRPLSASAGVVSLDGLASGAPERVLARADAAMYDAKAAGRGTCRLDRGGAEATVDEQLAKRTRQLALANILGARLAEMTEVEAIADATVEELRRAFGYHLSAVIRVRPDDQVEAVAVRGSSFLALSLRAWHQHRDAGLIGRCLRTRAPVLVNDVRREAGYQATPETVDVRAELVVPVVVDGHVWGALNVEELTVGAFDADDVVLLSALANQVAAGVRAVGLLERAARAESRLRAAA